MRLAFVDWIPWDYRVDSAYQMPLGGSQSALCYLTEELAKLRHEVFLFTYTSMPGDCHGVQCVSLRQPVPLELIHSLDAMIVLNGTGQGRALRSQLAAPTRLILWTQHAHDQPAMQPLHDQSERDVYDAIVVISD